MTKWIIAAVVVVLVVAGAWWWFAMPQGQDTNANQQATTTQDTNGMSAGSDSSNQALAQDTAAIDAQMQGLSQDSAAADASLSDQAVSQSY